MKRTYQVVLLKKQQSLFLQSLTYVNCYKPLMEKLKLYLLKMTLLLVKGQYSFTVECSV